MLNKTVRVQKTGDLHDLFYRNARSHLPIPRPNPLQHSGSFSLSVRLSASRTHADCMYQMEFKSCSYSFKLRKLAILLTTCHYFHITFVLCVLDKMPGKNPLSHPFSCPDWNTSAVEEVCRMSAKPQYKLEEPTAMAMKLGVANNYVMSQWVRSGNKLTLASCFQAPAAPCLNHLPNLLGVKKTICE